MYVAGIILTVFCGVTALISAFRETHPQKRSSRSSTTSK